VLRLQREKTCKAARSWQDDGSVPVLTLGRVPVRLLSLR
jgi:hypothetical protein